MRFFLRIFLFLLIAAASVASADTGSKSGNSGVLQGYRLCSAGPSGTTPRSTPVSGFTIVHEYPHDPDAFTQGLVFSAGFLYESTGLIGKSSLRQVELESGKIIRIQALEGNLFGEGLAVCNGRLIQLTWRSGIGFVYDRNTFGRVGEFKYSHEGWGITYDGSLLIVSDGTSRLRFWDPETFNEVGQIGVHDRDRAVTGLNELEFIKGEIFANVLGEDRVARISPGNGEILEWIDLTGLRAALGPVRRAEVLNGIAYDPERDRIFVTGKRWPKLFEIKIAPSGKGK